MSCHTVIHHFCISCKSKHFYGTMGNAKPSFSNYFDYTQIMFIADSNYPSDDLHLHFCVIPYMLHGDLRWHGN